MVLKVKRKAIITIMAEKGLSDIDIARNAKVKQSNAITQALKRGSCGAKVAGDIARGLGVPLDQVIELEDD